MTVTEMPPTAEADAVEADTGKKGKKGKTKKEKGGGKSNLVPAIVLAVGIAVGGFFMGSGGGEATVVEAPEVEEPALEPGEVVAVGPLTVNLSGGSYLRMGVSIQTSTEAELEIDKDGYPHFLPADQSQLLDQIIAQFGGQDPRMLASAAGREDARQELFDTANEMLDGQVLGVYFTEFVMQ